MTSRIIPANPITGTTQTRAGAADGKPFAPARHHQGGGDEQQEQMARPAGGAARGTRGTSQASDEGRAEGGREGSGADRASADGEAPKLSAGQQAIADAMSEADLERHISQICAGLGILRFHVPDSRGMERGLPDDILIGARGTLWRECKRENGKLRPEQRKVGEQLLEHGQDWALWRPSSLLRGEIAGQLTAISGMRVSAS